MSELKLNIENKTVVVNEGGSNIITIIGPGPLGGIGPSGSDGPSGSVGPQGPSGSQGLQGIPGPSGSTYIGNLATTGSNVFIGNQIITGSLLVTGNSSFIKNSGSTILIDDVIVGGGGSNKNLTFGSGPEGEIGLFKVSGNNVNISATSLIGGYLTLSSVSFFGSQGNNFEVTPTGLNVSLTNKNFFIHTNGNKFIVNLGSDATGDMFYRDPSGSFARLPAGTEGQILKMVSGLPTWSDI